MSPPPGGPLLLLWAGPAVLWLILQAPIPPLYPSPSTTFALSAAPKGGALASVPQALLSVKPPIQCPDVKG